MRLPVILVQNPPAGGTELAETLVGNLIGRPGLDLTLVDRLDSISPDSTDQMTLEGITVPSAVLDWRAPAQTLASLQAIGFNGRRCPHQLDRPDQSDQAVDHTASNDSGGISRRRIFLFDLNTHTDANLIIAELDRLRESLSVRTISISLGDNLSQPAAKPDSKPNAPSVGAPNHSRASHSLEMQPDQSEDLQSDECLDQLIDRLDELDV